MNTMINQQTIQGSWNEISGKIREKWGQLTDNDLQRFKGDAKQLVGFIQQKTGEAKGEVEKFLNDAMPEGFSLQHLAETAEEYATKAYDTAKESVDQVTGKLRDGYDSAEKMVQKRPGESVAAAFGAGLVAGLVVALLVRSR
jgi:uncharacterized protein YjbJ (UPF0337 family)